MGDWKTHVDGEKVTPAEQDEWLQEREYATIALRDTASAGWGAAEMFRQCKVVSTVKRYYWDGSAWLMVPSAAGGGGTSFEGTGTGSSPITIPHGLGAQPTKVFVSVNAVQPYAVAYNADATNVTVYHNAAGSLTVSVRAVL